MPARSKGPAGPAPDPSLEDVATNSESAVPEERPSMDIKLIRRLVRLMNGGGISELEIDDAKSGLRVRMRSGAREGEGQHSPVVYHLPAGSAAPAATPAPALASSGGGAMPAPSPSPGAGSGLVPVTSPLVGTFYRAASPDSDPYVEVGSRIAADTVVCIVEAMKVMNEIRAEITGQVVEVLVENGEPVEYGQPLFLIQKG